MFFFCENLECPVGEIISRTNFEFVEMDMLCPVFCDELQYNSTAANISFLGVKEQLK